MKIIINYKLSNWNDIINANRRNKYIGAREKKIEMGYISYFLTKVPKIEKYPIKIKCIWHVKNMGSDLDNKSLKAVLDAMQLKGILENDNIAHINEITYKAVKDTKDYLEMIIYEAD
jgi:Holliday junction resolvase RusA-like endonuclease